MRPAAIAGLVAGLAVAVPVLAEPDAALAQLQKDALKDKRAHATLRSLTTEVGHRFAGSEGDAKAVAWALRTLEAQGFANVRAEPVTVPRWVRGTARVEVVAPLPLALDALALGGSIGTPAEGIEAEVVAATDVDELKALTRERVEGRIVFLYADMLPTRDGQSYGTTVPIRSRGPIEAAKLGARAVVIRAVGTEDEQRPHTGSTRYAHGVPRIPAFAVGTRDAKRLLELYGQGPLRLRVSGSSSCQGTAQSANVIGEVVGRELPDELVLLGAHLDSWDVGTGAQDDGAGVATVIEAARRIGELAERPRRTVRVVLFADEEFGGSGADQYALAHEAELVRHVAALESDLGAGRVLRFESRVRPDDLRGAIGLARAVAPLGLAFAGNRATGGADLTPLREHGVPVFDLQHDASRYFEIHHTAADTIERVDAKDLAYNVAAYASVAWALADADRRFAPNPRTWPAAEETVNPCGWRAIP